MLFSLPLGLWKKCIKTIAGTSCIKRGDVFEFNSSQVDGKEIGNISKWCHVSMENLRKQPPGLGSCFQRWLIPKVAAAKSGCFQKWLLSKVVAFKSGCFQKWLLSKVAAFKSDCFQKWLLPKVATVVFIWINYAN